MVNFNFILISNLDSYKIEDDCRANQSKQALRKEIKKEIDRYREKKTYFIFFD